MLKLSKNLLLFTILLIYFSGQTVKSTPSPTNAVGYTFEESTLAAQFRDSIAPLRPGNPNGNYTFSGLTSCTSPNNCLHLLKSSNPYLYSLIGFILVPMIISIILYILYTFCCLPWCCCDTCTKKCCCQPCLGNPRERKCTKYGPLAVLAASLVVILWASIEGIVYNVKMHDDLFGSSDSITTNVDNLFGKAISLLEGVTPETNYIIDNINEVAQQLVDILKSEFNPTNISDNIVSAVNSLTYISKNIDLQANITDPLDSSKHYTYRFNCTYCSSAANSLTSVNKSVTTTCNQLNNFFETLNSTQAFVNAKNYIHNNTAHFTSTIDSFVNKSKDLQVQANSYLSTANTYDTQFEKYSNVYYCLPLLWIVFAGLGALIRTKYCFKLNWCCAMYLGATIMLIFSFFAVISVGWADFCVRLDDFEKNLGSSQLGETLNFVGSSSKVYDVINACFYGSSLLDVFNLSHYLDWSSYESKLENSIKFNFSSEIKTLNSSLQSYQNLTDQFTLTAFYSIVQTNIDTANNITNCRCGCTSCEKFNFSSLVNDTCTTSSKISSYWSDSSQASSSCVAAFLTAYESASAYKQLHNKIENISNEINSATTSLLNTFTLIVQDGNKFQTLIHNISNITAPIFQKFESVIYNYSNCAWLGQSYGGFKKVGCILLFTDMYYMSVSMSVLAFVSILIVLLAMMMDYVVHPLDKPKDEMFEWEQKLNVFERQISSKTLGAVADEAFLTTDGSPEVQMEAPMQNEPGTNGNLNPGEGGAQNQHSNGDIL